MRLFILALAFGSVFSVSAEEVADEAVQQAARADSAAPLEQQVEELARQKPYTPPVKPEKQFSVRDEKVLERSSGTITFREVDPPARKPKPVRIQPQPTAEQLARMERINEKGYINFTFFGTVWDESVTEVEWHYEGNQYRAFVSADLSFLHAMSDFETDESFYSVVGMLGHSETDKADYWVPNRENFISRGEEVSYIVVEPESGKLPEEAFANLNALLTHYEANQEKLWERYTELRASSLARKRYREANPPSGDVEVSFWKKEGEEQ